jgi:hypothetical protein
MIAKDASGRTRGPHEDISFDVLELDAVIFGCRMPSDERKSTADLVCQLYPATTLLQATKRTDS